MARKRKASGPAPANNNALPLPNAPTPSKKQRPKVDWNAIDEKGGFAGFTVKTVTGKTKLARRSSSSKKQRNNDDSPNARKAGYNAASIDAEIRQTNPYPQASLGDVCVKVEPQLEWESTSRYRKFTLNGEEFEVGQIVFIKKPDADIDDPLAIPQWFAKVLEVRAPDPSHVFLRVYWAYRPEDFPAGRQPHHGAAELIVSNHMDIIEAMTVESIAHVIHWTDDPEQSAWPAKDQLFWRQSFDITKPKSKQFSSLPTYCVDNAPCNPDEPLIHCPSCGTWLHAHCLEDSAVRDASSASQSTNRAHISAKLSTTDPKKTRLTVSIRADDEAPLQSDDVPVKCLVCSAVIDDVDPTYKPLERAGSESAAESESETVTVQTGLAKTTNINANATPSETQDSTDDTSAPESASTSDPPPAASTSTMDAELPLREPPAE